MIHTKHSPGDCEVCAAQVEADELGAIPTMGHTVELESTPDPKPDTRGVVMPGPVSQSNPGPSDNSPYIPSWLYKNGPKMCPCGHHEGYHGDNGGCNQWRKCGCTGIPENCRTPTGEME